MIESKIIETKDSSIMTSKTNTNTDDNYIETPWKIIESYFKGQHLDRLVRHQLESYNNFVGYQIIKTIEMFNPVCIASEQDFDPKSGKHALEIFVTFENFNIYRPQIHENNGATKLMFPQEARLRNFTYSSTMMVDMNIKYVIRSGENLENIQTLYKTLPKIQIGKLPIMLKSNICVLNQYKHVHHEQTGECKFDAGGYFIINGSEKTVLGQERAAENKVYVYNISKNSTKYTLSAEMKSVPDFKCISPKQINMMMSSKNNGFGFPITIQIPRVKQPIPLFVLFRALGVETDKEVCEKILLDISCEKHKDILQGLQASIIDANTYMTKEESIKYIMSYVMFTPINMDRETGIRKKHEFTLDVLNNDVFPHCSNMVQKVYFLGYMASRLLQVSFDWMKCDDRDSYLNKRIDLTGTLLNNLFRNYFNKLVKDMEKQVIKEINNGSWKSTDDYAGIINMTNIYKIIKSTTIENGLKRALSTGDFGIKHSNSNKVGVAQVLNRLTYVSSLSHARRIATPTDKSGKLIPPRKLHGTSWGFLCLTGDTEVLLSNRIDRKRIADVRDGDWVNTINPRTLRDEPSDVHTCFQKMPDKLFEMTTCSGRKIKATGNHPFLINNGGNYEWKNMEDLKNDDKVIIRHMVKHIPDENTTVVFVNEADVLENYRMELLKLKLLNVNIPVDKLKIIARLIGSINTNGHIKIVDDNGLNYQSSFYLGEECDACQVADDIQQLGFGNVLIVRKVNNQRTTWELSKSGAFAFFLYFMGGFVGKKTDMIRKLPQWLLTAELSIKREFLSAFQGGSRLGHFRSDGVWKPIIASMFQTTNDTYLQETMEYMQEIVTMFSEFEIVCRIAKQKINKKNTSIRILFNNSSENVLKYTNVVNYAYCEEKRRASTPIIEYLKIREYHKETSLEYYEFIRDNMLDNSCVSVSILSVKEIEPEFVYDFTTRSVNHSFVASSFVTHNCGIETPEGQSVGVVKNLSYMAHCTIHSNSQPIYDYVMPNIIDIQTLQANEMYDKTKVFINGAWVGITENPLELFTNLKDKKQKGIINVYTSIVFNYSLNEIRICNDAGRLTRPLLRVKNGTTLLTPEIIDGLGKKKYEWEDLMTNCVLDEAIIEYIDPEEQAFSLIAMTPKDLTPSSGNEIFKHTHCEIHPSTIFGVLASCIPFPEHNQSPRNCYQTAQAKQAMGVYVSNFANRMDKTAYVLNYPGRPLVDTRIMDMIKINQIPSGFNVVVAIMTHTGYNQEDSLLFNKGSLDRGLFQATIYHTEKDEDKQKINGDEEIRCKPDPTKTKGMKFANYNKVNHKGVIPENTLVENRDVIISKITPIKENRNDHTKLIKYEDQSRIYRTDEETFIDKNYIDRNGDGYNFAKVRLRTTRKPVIGDKFSSRSGQKGTIGNIIPEEDMPFTSSGLKPDLILNPHAIPSRMTIAQLKETILAKVLLQLGLYGDGTSFGDLNVDTICELLLKVGYEAHGNELMYNGLTGEQHECTVFTGPVFYQRLKHMVSDKQHSRSIGPMVNLTRQPAEGRSRDGGLRFGEMERDAMISHGASKFIRGRMYDASDKYQVHVCKKCGLIATYNDSMHVHICNTCENRSDFAYVEIPYACKLLFQELITMNIAPRIMTNH